MKRSMLAILSILLLFCAFSIAAYAEEKPDWKKEYLEFIVDDYNALTPNGREATTYQIMYVASDGVPFIYISHGSTAGGGAFCYIDGNEIVTEQTSIIDFEYIKGSDAFFETGGRMGSYFNVVYALEDSGVVKVGEGSYGGEYGVLLEDDTGVVPVNEYIWNEEEVSREEYQREFYGLRDKYLTPEDEIIYVDGYGYDASSYDEIIAWFAEQDDQSVSEVTFSGVYADMLMGSDVASQINFDSQNGTFVLSYNMLYDWEIIEGPYSVDSAGIIECKAVRTLNSYDNLVTEAENQHVFRFSVNGDRITLLDGENSGGFDFSRIGDGFTIVPDSGKGTITGDAVRVRSGPGTEYPVFTSLNAGNQVSIIGTSGEWYRIECVDNNGWMFWGFMRSDYVAKG